MRDVGHFVGRNHAVDNGRVFRLERLVDGLEQLARPFGFEAHAAAGARQRHVIRIGEVNGLFPGRHSDRFGLKRDQSEGRIVAVSDLAARDAVFVFDCGANTLWSGNWTRQSGQQRIIGSFNNAAVGTALGQANGIQALDRSRQVIALCGDGGFNMLMCEFFTAVDHKLPVEAVVYMRRFGVLRSARAAQRGVSRRPYIRRTTSKRQAGAWTCPETSTPAGATKRRLVPQKGNRPTTAYCVSKRYRQDTTQRCYANSVSVLYSNV